MGATLNAGVSAVRGDFLRADESFLVLGHTPSLYIPKPTAIVAPIIMILSG